MPGNPLPIKLSLSHKQDDSEQKRPGEKRRADFLKD